MQDNHAYVGTELGLFSQAHRWKSYFRDHLQRYLRGDVLEVGAGLGGTTRVFAEAEFQSWTCLEPDQRLLDQLQQTLVESGSTARFHYRQGTLASLEPKARYDAVIYIDVLEHIEHDAEEVARAAQRLRQGGHLVILSPAYQFLFSPFDAHIGHFRRYTLARLRALTPRECRVKRGFYLDSVGALASLSNRLFLKSSMPSSQQIAFWDRVLVRLSQLLDPLHGYSFGRSVVIVWRKEAQIDEVKLDGFCSHRLARA
jgi:SAM-dependent methyltransferase